MPCAAACCQSGCKTGCRSAEEKFALAIALAQDRREIVVHDILGGEVHAEACLCGLRSNEINRRARSGRARPFDVQVGFRFITLHDSWIGTVKNNLKVGRGKTKICSKSGYVLQIYIRIRPRSRWFDPFHRCVLAWHSTEAADYRLWRNQTGRQRCSPRLALRIRRLMCTGGFCQRHLAGGF